MPVDIFSNFPTAFVVNEIVKYSNRTQLRNSKGNNTLRSTYHFI